MCNCPGCQRYRAWEKLSPVGRWLMEESTRQQKQIEAEERRKLHALRDLMKSC